MMPTEQPQAAVADEPLASLDAAMDAWTDPGEVEPEEEEQSAEQQADAGPDEQDDGGLETPADDDFTEGDAEAEPQDGPDEYKSGQFAADSARVKLDDGSTITIAELKRGSMRDADYTRGKMALAEERRSFDAERQAAKQLDTELQTQREIIMALAEQMAPKRPDPSLIDTDLASFTLQERAWQAFQESLHQLGAQMEGHRGRQKSAAQESRKTYLAAERGKLEERDARFKNKEWRDDFFKRAEDAGKVFGYTPEEFYSLSDHRHFMIMEYALEGLRVRRERAKLKKGNGQQQQPTRTLNGQRRPGNVQAQKLQSAKARFAKNPTLRNAVDLLPD